MNEITEVYVNKDDGLVVVRINGMEDHPIILDRGEGLVLRAVGGLKSWNRTGPEGPATVMPLMQWRES